MWNKKLYIAAGVASIAAGITVASSMQKEAKIILDDQSKKKWYKRPVSATIGRVNSVIPDALIFAEPSLAFRTPDAQNMLAAAKKVDAKFGKKTKTDLVLRINAVDTKDDLKRIWNSKRLNVPTKVWGTVATPIANATVSMGRSDHYNPFTSAATIYTDKPAVAAHEAGHYTDLASSDHMVARTLAKIVLPPVSLYDEYQATSRALGTVSGKEKLEYQKTLYPAFGSYVGSLLAGQPLGGILAGHLVARTE